MLSRFVRNEKGNVAIMFAVAAIPMIGATGAVVDYTRAYDQQTIVQSALDSAALAANRLVGVLTEKEVKEEAQKFFLANTDGKIPNQPIVKVTVSKGSVELTTTLDVKTDFLGLFGLRTLEFDLRALSVAGNATYEVVMVLDNSGSMSGSKISSLREAAKDLTKVLFEVNKSNTKPDPIKIGIVPFAASVNVGAGYADESWIDADAKAPYHSENFDDATVTRFDAFDMINNVKWQGCVEARPSPYDVSDDAPTSSKPETLFVPMFAPDESDEGRFSNNYLKDDGGSCDFAEKDDGKGKDKGKGKGKGKDSGDGSVTLESLTDEERQALTCKYDKENLSGDHKNGVDWGPNVNCTAVELQPLTTNRGMVESHIARMKADGMTNIHSGIMWGWRLLSQGAPFTEGRSLDDDDNHKIMIVMTDGQNTYTTYDNFNKSMYGGFGYIGKNHLGTTSSKNSTVIGKMNEKTLAACTNAKADKIMVYTIAFKVSDATTRTLLEKCATRVEMAFRSDSNTELVATFQKIAQEISMLRLAE